MRANTRDRIIDSAIVASQRRQKKLGDDLALDMLAALAEAEGGEIVLSRQYNIKIVLNPDPLPTSGKPLTLAEERKVWQQLALGSK